MRSQSPWCHCLGRNLSSHLVEPFFFQGTVNGTYYLDNIYWKINNFQSFLSTHILVILLPTWWWPLHYTTKIRKWLDENFPGHWLGPRGTFEWPAKFPDPTPLDFFLWRVLKNCVYVNKPHSIDELKQSIQQEWNQIMNNICRNYVVV